jgi:hypothetical protein
MLFEIIFFTIWITLGILVIVGGYYEKDWVNFIWKFPGLSWLRERYGATSARIFFIIIGAIWALIGVRFLVETIWETDWGKIVLSGLVIILGSIVAYYYLKTKRQVVDEHKGNS